MRGPPAKGSEWLEPRDRFNGLVARSIIPARKRRINMNRPDDGLRDLADRGLDPDICAACAEEGGR